MGSETTLKDDWYEALMARRRQYKNKYSDDGVIDMTKRRLRGHDEEKYCAAPLDAITTKDGHDSGNDHREQEQVKEEHRAAEEKLPAERAVSRVKTFKGE
jgi:hypothetical protein